MRNQFAGTCYRCGQTVAPGDGHFERIPLSAGQGKWRMQHATREIDAAAIAHELDDVMVGDWLLQRAQEVKNGK